MRVLACLSFLVLGVVAGAPVMGQWSTVTSSEPRASLSAATIGDVPEGLSADDWADIRAAYDAGRHAAYSVEGGHQAHNPGQQWRTRFDGYGSLTQPDAGGWSWGLKLERYGFAGDEQEVTGPAHVSAEGGRVEYEWDATLVEWYENDTRGLEHGYTVHHRLDKCGESPLMFTLAVRGELRAHVTADGRGVRFLDESGALTLTYTGLSVFDADGRELEASLEGLDDEGVRLLLSVDERGARYPISIDPIAQQAYLKASNTGVDDRFGFSVAVSGDTVVVGAPLEDSDATGVNGDESDNSALSAGAAYVFVRNGTSWSQEAYLKASNTDADDLFGERVAVSGDTVVVGAWVEASSATGVNGNQSDNSAIAAGAAYVFVRSGTSWSQEAYLKASNTEAFDVFGQSVAVSGDTVVVGAHNEDSSATGVNGNQSDNSAGESGAVYVFVRSGTIWSQQAYLKASNTDAQDGFGWRLAASGETVVVGVENEASSATGVNGNQSDNSAIGAGAAYVFVRSGTSWSQEAYLKASNTQTWDYFGHFVAVSGDTVVVGAPWEDSNATGVNGNPFDNSAEKAGAAYVFTRSGTSWSQQAYLKASNTDADDRFGASVGVTGDTVAVGAPREASSATGANGNQSDNSAPQAGAAYLFVRSGTSWNQDAYLKASNTDPGDLFGRSVAVSGDTVVVGAFKEASNSTGANGNQSDNSAPLAGAAYMFCSGCGGLGISYCTPATPNSTGLPGTIIAMGSDVVIDNDVTLTADQLPPGLFGYFLAGQTQGLFTPPGSQGVICLMGNIGRYNAVPEIIQGPTGNLQIDLTSIPVNPPQAVLPGDTWNFQCWFRDSNPGPTSNFTDAVGVTFL